MPCNDAGLSFGQLVEARSAVVIDGQHITLAHGNGGHFMRELIEEVFARHLVNPRLDIDADAAHVRLPDGEVLR